MNGYTVFTVAIAMSALAVSNGQAQAPCTTGDTNRKLECLSSEIENLQKLLKSTQIRVEHSGQGVKCLDTDDGASTHMADCRQAGAKWNLVPWTGN